ncbi:crotonyl-CoA carboxylase/reductase [Rhodococcus qingshengii]|uniref:Crotonyl-CoA carboxylase/reductase n=1 Tax=Rhodococcus qingshengii TaxID=334542 RepID=A0AAW6LN38_RHOSG|nr:crotonyl-CoA carboxylase/reductase [Rhodococcus qingshengii]MDE8647606.1 crotonyl-CoA carboxylase/reductase [Rhodococcus qingshengii]
MDSLAQAVIDGATPEQLANEPVPTQYRAAHIRREDSEMFRGVDDKDVRKSIHVGDVPMPDLAPDEVLVAVMASAINFNTVWSATFEPVSTFRMLARLGREGGFSARHDQDHQVIGSDASGVVVRVGAGVRRCKIGDHVVVNPAFVDDQEPATHQDGMMGTGQLAWGYETNFGGLANYAVVRASQILPKPEQLTWEEAASFSLCAGTAYRMLVSDKGARIKQGDIVMIWGATGGLGAFAVQLVKNGGGIAVGIVGSEEKVALAKELGCDFVINRANLKVDDSLSHADRSVAVGKQIGKLIRAELGEDPRIVFDYVGRETFATSVFVAARGGTVVTCGSTTGYQHEFDNRYLWMNLKRIIGSHGVNYGEMAECTRLFQRGMLLPMISSTYALDSVGEAARLVQRNDHVGKVAVLCLAPEPGLGVTDAQKRAQISTQIESLRAAIEVHAE